MRVHEFVIAAYFTREDLARLSSESARFRSDIKLEFAHGDGINIVDVKSLLGMLLLPIRSGTRVLLRVKGKDEEEAFLHMLELLEKE
ncbi:HPr family phosphocarrier protein [Paenibacillus sp. D51F]